MKKLLTTITLLLGFAIHAQTFDFSCAPAVPAPDGSYTASTTGEQWGLGVYNVVIENGLLDLALLSSVNDIPYYNIVNTRFQTTLISTSTSEIVFSVSNGTEAVFTAVATNPFPTLNDVGTPITLSSSHAQLYLDQVSSINGWTIGSNLGNSSGWGISYRHPDWQASSLDGGGWTVNLRNVRGEHGYVTASYRRHFFINSPNFYQNDGDVEGAIDRAVSYIETNTPSYPASGTFSGREVQTQLHPFENPTLTLSSTPTPTNAAWSDEEHRFEFTDQGLGYLLTQSNGEWSRLGSPFPVRLISTSESTMRVGIFNGGVESIFDLQEVAEWEINDSGRYQHVDYPGYRIEELEAPAFGFNVYFVNFLLGKKNTFDSAVTLIDNQDPIPQYSTLSQWASDNRWGSYLGRYNNYQPPTHYGCGNGPTIRRATFTNGIGDAIQLHLWGNRYGRAARTYLFVVENYDNLSVALEVAKRSYENPENWLQQEMHGCYDESNVWSTGSGTSWYARYTFNDIIYTYDISYNYTQRDYTISINGISHGGVNPSVTVRHWSLVRGIVFSDRYTAQIHENNSDQYITLTGRWDTLIDGGTYFIRYGVIYTIDHSQTVFVPPADGDNTSNGYTRVYINEEISQNSFRRYNDVFIMNY